MLNRYTATTALGAVLFIAGLLGIFLMSAPVIAPAVLMMLGAVLFFFSPAETIEEDTETYMV